MNDLTVKPSRADGDVMTGLDLVRRGAAGSAALKLAFVGPAVVLLVVGGLDLLAITRSQDRLQAIAVAAAEAGVRTMVPSDDAAAARARAAAVVVAEMRRWPNSPTYEAEYQVVDRAGAPALRVVLRGHRPSLLANMLPPGGWRFVGDASAMTTGAGGRAP